MLKSIVIYKGIIAEYEQKLGMSGSLMNGKPPASATGSSRPSPREADPYTNGFNRAVGQSLRSVISDETLAAASDGQIIAVTVGASAGIAFGAVLGGPALLVPRAGAAATAVGGAATSATIGGLEAAATVAPGAVLWALSPTGQRVLSGALEAGLNGAGTYYETGSVGAALESAAGTMATNGSLIGGVRNKPAQSGNGSCFVAGTSVLVSGTDAEPILVKAELLPAGDRAGTRWYMAGAGLALGILALEEQFSGTRRSRKCRRRSDEEHIDSDDIELIEPDLGECPDDENSCDRHDIIRGEDEMAAKFVFEFTQHAPPRPAGRVPPACPALRPGRKWPIARITVGLLLAVCCVARGLWGSADSARVAKAPQSAARPASVAIETLRVGQRVLTDGDPAVPHATAVDPATWRYLCLEGSLPWEDGTQDVINIETLQSPEWVAEHEARVGGSVPIPVDLVEMGLPEELRATVLRVDQCPELQGGPGQVVLTTVNHLNRYVLELSLRGNDGTQDTVRPTGLCKYYSESREGRVSAADLRDGEVLRGVAGPVTVAGLTRVPGVHRVYNMSVESEHVYRVSQLGVLVHNPGCSEGSGIGPDHVFWGEPGWPGGPSPGQGSPGSTGSPKPGSGFGPGHIFWGEPGWPGGPSPAPGSPGSTGSWKPGSDIDPGHVFWGERGWPGSAPPGRLPQGGTSSTGSWREGSGTGR